MDFLNLNIPPNKTQPGAGKLLIAEPFLNDTNFTRSVVFLCEHSADGTVGFILNHLTEINLGDILPDLYPATAPIFEGGPVQEDTLHMLHRVPAILGGNEILPGIYWGGSYEILQDLIKENRYNSSDIRLYVGYSGWSAGQLDKEMEENSWLVTDAASSILFDTDHKDIWKAAIGLLGKDYAFLANMPVNPQLN